MEVSFNGWEKCIRLANAEIELILTTLVGPRIVRFGFVNDRNLFAELDGQQGGRGEKEWKLRGGHRFWVSPECMETTYELDNEEISYRKIPHGVVVTQPIGELSHMAKEMKIELEPDRNVVSVTHTLKNCGEKAVDAAAWALSVMACHGRGIVPLPAKIAHSDIVSGIVKPNQTLNLWSYTDLTDPRWMFGSRYVALSHARDRGPTKIGLAHRMGWSGYQLGEFVFVKYFKRDEARIYPDNGSNFQMFANEDFVEMETLGPLEHLLPDQTVSHTEKWHLLRGIGPCSTEDSIDRLLVPLLDRSAL